MSFEQEIISELTKKITLFDDYVNGIDCELEKGIQQHPGNKEIENIRLLWKEKLVKKARKEIEGDKETEPERVYGTVDSGTEFVVLESFKQTEGEKETEAVKEMEVDLACEEAIDSGTEIEVRETCQQTEGDRETEGDKEMEVDRAGEGFAIDSGTKIVVRETCKEREGGKETEGDKEMEVVFQKSDAQKNIDDQYGASGSKDKVLQNNSECTDWEKHSKISALTPITLSSFDEQLDPVKDACIEKEPSSDLVPYDGPSFDMGLTPAPQGISTIFK